MDNKIADYAPISEDKSEILPPMMAELETPQILPLLKDKLV
jgi:hypothetical protein